ncbi:MarR family transcriptional regulator [Novosphingobium sp. 1949]|uniref:MarR family transcriptional regulator n=1 Tax=Novosphingobium organovorum TaxID=2930092 RepID=A0ABT0BC22_9SPHN|nr:MarR family transcriptional regulator [Novosphingobium organovorum]MCJ2182600.1 MarR family transcriptional regulator [Novosphingobium organovorum]
MDMDSGLYTSLQRGRTAGFLTSWAARLYTREMDAHLAQAGIGAACLPVLLALAPRGEEPAPALTQRDLARIACVEQPTMANTLGRMERDGWITRTAHPGDRRAALVRLTPQACAHVPALEHAASAINARALAGLTMTETVQLRDLMLRVIANLDAS